MSSCQEIKVGDVFYIPLKRTDGLILTQRYEERYKFLVVLGFTPDGYVVGGVVFNSKVNQRVPIEVQIYQLPIDYKKYSFLSKPSFIDCATIFLVEKERLKEKVGELIKEDLEFTIGAILEAPTIDESIINLLGLK